MFKLNLSGLGAWQPSGRENRAATLTLDRIEAKKKASR